MKRSRREGRMRSNLERRLTWATAITAATLWMTAGGTPAAEAYPVLPSFSSSDGANPNARLVQASDGYLYGTTSSGGDGGAGTVFRIDTSGNLTTLHSFVGNDGNNPAAGLIEASDGF